MAVFTAFDIELVVDGKKFAPGSRAAKPRSEARRLAARRAQDTFTRGRYARFDAVVREVAAALAPRAVLITDVMMPVDEHDHGVAVATLSHPATGVGFTYRRSLFFGRFMPFEEEDAIVRREFTLLISGLRDELGDAALRR